MSGERLFAEEREKEEEEEIGGVKTEEDEAETMGGEFFTNKEVVEAVGSVRHSSFTLETAI